MDGDLRRHITLKGLSILLQPTFAHLYTMYKVLVNFKMILKCKGVQEKAGTSACHLNA
jgi:hypothetical protein